MGQRENILRIKGIYNALGELKDRVVFVGGATVALYADRISEEVRPTDDIDVLIELADYGGYAEVENRLRVKGFVNDKESGIICRYIVQGIVVDIMPTEKGILGFTNRWYPKGYQTAVKHEIEDNYLINIFRPEYFVASKIEAFKGRGRNDGRTSSDFEDLVYVFNSRRSLWFEMENAEKEVKTYLKKEFNVFLSNVFLPEWISAHLEFSQQHRVNYILDNLKDFVL